MQRWTGVYPRLDTGIHPRRLSTFFHNSVEVPRYCQKNNSEVKFNWSDGGIRPFHPELIQADDWLGEPDSGNGVIMIGTKGIMTCGTYGTRPQVYLNNGDKLTMSTD